MRRKSAPIQFDNNSLQPALKEKSAAARKGRAQLHEQSGRVITPRNDLTPDIRIEWIAVDDIKLPKRRVRRMAAEDIEGVVNSILAFGFSDTLLVGRNRQLIDGDLALEAAKSLGMSHVPCDVIEHLTDAEERSFRQANNEIGARRPYDLPELKKEFQELIALHQPIEILGFTSIELDQILADDPEIEEEVPAPAPDAIAVTQRGDLWVLGEHRLLCGDAKVPEDYDRVLSGEEVRLVLTDPPYAVAISKVVSTPHRDFVEGGGDMTEDEFQALISACFKTCHDRLASGGILMSFMDWKHVAHLVAIGTHLGFEHLNLVTWVKPQGGMGSFYRSQTEFVVMLKREGKHINNIKLGANGRDRTNAWHYAGAGTRGTDAAEMLKEGHPTPKPAAMLFDAILDVTHRGDIVLDPFGGSGTTLMAAHKAGRKARLIELDPLYCDLIIRRWQNESGEQARLGEDGPTFDEIAAVGLQGDAELPHGEELLETIDARA